MQTIPPRLLAPTTPAQLPSPSITIQGTHVTISPLNRSLHAQSLGAGLCDPSLWTYVYKNQQGFTPPSNAQQLLDFLQTIPFQVYVIQKKGQESTNKCLGCYALYVYPEDLTCQIAYVLFSKQLQKTIMGTEAIYLLFKYGYQSLNYTKCFWKCHVMNRPSRSAALRYGLKYEGVNRANLIHRGCYRHTMFFGMLREEWEVMKKEFERWLGEENFDGEGKQKSKLRCAEIRGEMEKGEGVINMR